MSDTTNTVLIKGRLIHKHDTEANWNKATNFYPRLGEIIVYDPDENYSYPRYKIGIWDGDEKTKTEEKLITKLPFADHPEVGVAVRPQIVAVGRDEKGHVVLGDELVVTSGGGGEHAHTTTTSIPQDTYVTEVSPSTIKLSVAPTTTTVVKTVGASASKLVTTNIVPVSDSQTATASRHSAGTPVAVAKAGTAVVYGTANVGTTVSVAQAAASSSTFVTSVTAAAPTTTIVATKDLYNAAVEDDTLVLSAVTLSATTSAPALTATTDSVWGVSETVNVTSAVAAPDNQTIIPAVANGNITPYTFSDVVVPVAVAPVEVATGSLSLAGTGEAVVTGLTDLTTATVMTAAAIKSDLQGDVSVVVGTSVTKNNAASFSGTTSAYTYEEHTHNLVTDSSTNVSYSMRATTPAVSAGSDGVFEFGANASDLTSVEINGQTVDPSNYVVQ